MKPATGIAQNRIDRWRPVTEDKFAVNWQHHHSFRSEPAGSTRPHQGPDFVGTFPTLAWTETGRLPLIFRGTATKANDRR